MTKITPFMLFLFVGCSDPSDGGSASVSPALPRSAGVSAAHTFLADTTRVSLSEGRDSRLVAPAGLVSADEGDIYVADASEGVVHQFRLDGSFVRDIGSRGDGPGEFRTPAYPTLGQDGTLYVTDLTKSHVAVFSRSGEFKRNVSFEGVSRIDQVAVDSAGRFWVLGNARERNDDRILTIADQEGRTLSSLLPIAQFLPVGETDQQLWASSRRPSLAVGRTHAFVVLSIVDSLWTVSLSDLSVSRSVLGHPMYRTPKPPSSPVRSRQDHRKWLESNLLVSGVSATKEGAVVSYSAGIYFEQDNTLASVILPGRVVHLDSAPPIIGSSPSRLFQLKPNERGQFFLTSYGIKPQ